mmetsp:Transcript_9890/g.34175  ORF Transcript_9890/g.34175 Transcript_9890/m.34175 type:complete len:458 (+) Transcript_9890:3733-5106(+)
MPKVASLNFWSFGATFRTVNASPAACSPSLTRISKCGNDSEPSIRCSFFKSYNNGRWITVPTRESLSSESISAASFLTRMVMKTGTTTCRSAPGLSGGCSSSSVLKDGCSKALSRHLPASFTSRSSARPSSAAGGATSCDSASGAGTSATAGDSGDASMGSSRATAAKLTSPKFATNALSSRESQSLVPSCPSSAAASAGRFATRSFSASASRFRSDSPSMSWSKKARATADAMAGSVRLRCTRTCRTTRADSAAPQAQAPRTSLRGTASRRDTYGAETTSAGKSSSAGTARSTSCQAFAPCLRTNFCRCRTRRVREPNLRSTSTCRASMRASISSTPSASATTSRAERSASTSPPMSCARKMAATLSTWASAQQSETTRETSPTDQDTTTFRRSGRAGGGTKPRGVSAGDSEGGKPLVLDETRCGRAENGSEASSRATIPPSSGRRAGEGASDCSS